MNDNVVYLPPRGHYLADEVGRLAGVSGHRIGQWARRGYIRSSQSEGPPRVYSYQDVAEAMAVHELRTRGIEFSQIMETIRNLREASGNSWPLTYREISVAHKRVVTHDQDVYYDISNIAWHELVLDERDVKRIASDLRRGGWAARDLPQLEHIEIDPGRLSGRPVIRGTRVPAELVAELASQPDGRTDLRDGYGLTDDEIDDALAWWQAVRAYEVAA